MFETTEDELYRWLGVGFLVLLDAVVLGLAARTVLAVRQRQICVPG